MKKLTLIILLVFPCIHIFGQFNQSVLDTIPWDTITFEKPYEYLSIDVASQNIWQVGVPYKEYFGSSYSLPNAIVTDTVNSYPTNNYSYFDIKIGEFNYNYYYMYYVGMEIKHKYDTDTLKDGGYITVSYDYGTTWMNIINDTSYFYDISPDEDYWSSDSLYNEEDLLYNGEFGFSGKSNGWQTTYFSWFFIPVKSPNNIPDTTYIRFNFISDSINNNREGWMLDDIKLLSVDLGGVTSENNKDSFKIIPNPLVTAVKVVLRKKYSKVNAQIITLTGQIIVDRTHYNCNTFELQKGNLLPGIYLLKIVSEDKLIGIEKLVIE